MSFFELLMAVTVGNLLAVAFGLAVVGFITIQYTASDGIGMFSGFIGYILMMIVGVISFKIGFQIALFYVIFCIAVACIQISYFDMRKIEAVRSKIDGKDIQYFVYRWMVYSESKVEGRQVRIDRSELVDFVIGYIGCAPFLVLRWVFQETIANIAEFIASRIQNRLQSRLKRIFGIE